MKTMLNIPIRLLAITAGVYLAPMTGALGTDCPCDNGTSHYLYDTTGDGIPDSCYPPDLNCEEHGIASTGGWLCCGNTEYDPEYKACCGENIQNVGEWEIGTWCNDCTYVDKWSDHVYCCNSDSGTREYLKTISCACFNCIMEDCVASDWDDFFSAFIIYKPDGTATGAPGIAYDLVELMVKIVLEGTYCRQKVCPDFPC